MLNHADTKYKITVVGGKGGIEVLARSSNRGGDIEFLSMDRDYFLAKIAGVERFITTSGSTAVNPHCIFTADQFKSMETIEAIIITQSGTIGNAMGKIC